jgi:hypothetical protein
MKKLVALLIGVGLIAGSAQGDLLLRYGFGTMDGATVLGTNTADLVATGLSAGTIAVINRSGASIGVNYADFSTGPDTTTISNFPNPSGFPHGWMNATSLWAGDNPNDNSDVAYWRFTITADPTWTFTITNVTYAVRSPTSMQYVSLAIGTDDTIHTHTIVNNANSAVFAPVSGYNDLTTAEIRLYGWNDTGTGGGQFRIDDIQVFGSVIPEPGTVALLMLGFGGLMAFARRRKQ